MCHMRRRIHACGGGHMSVTNLPLSSAIIQPRTTESMKRADSSAKVLPNIYIYIYHNNIKILFFF
jgi:predicted urease superfamily metal-dependent hydrolase